MSYRNLKFRKWTKDGAVRVYVNAQHVEGRCHFSQADGGYFSANDADSITWHHGFKCGPNTIVRAERVAFGMQEIIRSYEFDKITFSELLSRIDASLTKSGNFSMTRYEKQYG